MKPALEPRWANLCKQAGLDGSAEWRELSTMYGDPGRAYHNIDHIADCLLRFDEHAHLAVDPVALEFAIWFHDIVYDARAADNEERSAMAAERFLAATAFGSLVGDLIRATKHHVTTGTPDAALLCDIDLSILGRSPGEYDAYLLEDPPSPLCQPYGGSNWMGTRMAKLAGVGGRRIAHPFLPRQITPRRTVVARPVCFDEIENLLGMINIAPSVSNATKGGWRGAQSAICQACFIPLAQKESEV